MSQGPNDYYLDQRTHKIGYKSRDVEGKHRTSLKELIRMSEIGSRHTPHCFGGTDGVGNFNEPCGLVSQGERKV